MKTKRGIQWKRTDDRRGAALVFASALAIALAGLAIVLLMMNLGTKKVRTEGNNAKRSFYAAEAGLSDVYVRMSNGLVDLPDDEPVFVGSPDDPIALGPMSYWVEINRLDNRTFSLASTGVRDGVQERLELVLGREPTGFFQYAAFGAEGVLLDSNAFIDSYDSTYGDYESQVQDGEDYALENGNVGSNGDIKLRSNTEIHGDVTPGPGGIVDDSAPRTYISGSTDAAEEPFPMPPIEVPVIPSLGSRRSSRSLVLGPGEVHYDSLLMEGGTKLVIRGPATVVFDRFGMRSGAAMIFDTSNGPIDLHGTGDFVLESNTDMVTFSDSAVDVQIWLSGNNMTARRRNRVELSSNADFVGAIYAPNIFYRLNSNFKVFGSIICGRLDLSSNGEIHFDEALLYDGDGDSNDYSPTLWRVLPLQ